jgi:hypothetical protein
VGREIIHSAKETSPSLLTSPALSGSLEQLVSAATRIRDVKTIHGLEDLLLIFIFAPLSLEFSLQNHIDILIFFQVIRKEFCTFSEESTK